MVSCASSKSNATAEEMAALTSLVNNRNFNIESDWAYPLSTMAMQQVLNSGLLQPGNSAGAISLIGNSNFLTISGDSISSYLPYYGERQMQVNYGGGDSAIQFDGLLEDYELVKNKNGSYTMSFVATSKSEQFNTNITIFPNLRSEIFLNSASRFPIRYSGVVVEQEE
tara:strand:+ start:580 stop:1083 length:504 start_codon:yes stop_codon:yes gene_type:complete